MRKNDLDRFLNDAKFKEDVIEHGISDHTQGPVHLIEKNFMFVLAKSGLYARVKRKW